MFRHNVAVHPLAVAVFLCICLFCVTAVVAEEERGDDFADFINVKRTGDYDAMVEQHIIRFLIPNSKTYFFLDGATPRGLSYDATKLFGEFINKRLKKGHVKVKTIVIPTSRDRLIPDLVAGLGDVALGNLTITDDRKKSVDFSDPFFGDVKEIVVSGKGQKTLKNLFDLSGKEIYVRKSSSYYESLRHVNKTLKGQGNKPIVLKTVSEHLEDEDLLEMVNAAIIPRIVMDDHKAELWKHIFKNIQLHSDVVINSGGRIAWAIRKNNPKLKTEINAFVKKNKKGTLTFNMLVKRYLEETDYIKNNISDEEIKKFNRITNFFRKYGEEFSFDWILLGALAYQESGLDNSKKSKAGAVGIMQVLPSTASDPNVGVNNIRKLENNIHAGTKYLRFMRDRYYSGDDIDELNKALFSFASYNAGPAKIARLRKEAGKRGLNPNIWFNNVEVIAAKKIGRETVQYVSNIYKYYIAYKLILETSKSKKKAADKLK